MNAASYVAVVIHTMNSHQAKSLKRSAVLEHPEEQVVNEFDALQPEVQRRLRELLLAASKRGRFYTIVETVRSE